ncbi:MAG: pyridoxal 5-phosphate synthase pdxT subunit [Actinomycetota bacterium]|nr:pyridoxal 5-phosphate synthase pdxT subunit [Actinomycetota bacterium]
MTTPVIGVFALQGDVREHVRTLEGIGADVVPVRRPEDIDGIAGLVLPGGESTTMYKLAAAFDLLEPLRKAVAAGLPAYGSCAGMIMLADTIQDGIDGQHTIGGLDIVVRRNAFGRQVDSFEADLDFAEVDGGPVHAVFIRAPWVEDIGAGVQVLARVEGGPADGRVVAVRGGADGQLLATSFHPELTGDARVHELFLRMVRERS